MGGVWISGSFRNSGAPIRTPDWTCWQKPQLSDKQAALELKAWISSEKVVWESRRLYAVLSPERHKLDLKKVLNRYKSEWSVIWQSYDVSESKALCLNREGRAQSTRSPSWRRFANSAPTNGACLNGAAASGWVLGGWVGWVVHLNCGKLFNPRSPWGLK